MSHDAWHTLISGRNEWGSGRIHFSLNKVAHVSRMLFARLFLYAPVFRATNSLQGILNDRGRCNNMRREAEVTNEGEITPETGAERDYQAS
jgi:hypothetical protein